MCIRDSVLALHPGVLESAAVGVPDEKTGEAIKIFVVRKDPNLTCLLYTSDAADERSSVDLGGRRIIKKKKQRNI